MWNNRIIKQVDGSFGLYEVMYNDDKEIIAHDERPMITGGSVDDIKQSLQLMIDDVEKYQHDILEIDNIVFAPMYDEDEEFVELDIDELLDKVKKDIC